MHDLGLEPHLIQAARDFARRLGAIGPMELRCASGSRGECQDVLSSVRPRVKALSGMDFNAPCYLVIMQGEFRPPRPANDKPGCVEKARRAAALIIDVRSGHAVGSCVSVDVPDSSSMKLIAAGTI